MIGADEGLYTLNLNEIHEASLELVSFLIDFNMPAYSCDFHVDGKTFVAVYDVHCAKSIYTWEIHL